MSKTDERRRPVSMLELEEDRYRTVNTCDQMGSAARSLAGDPERGVIVVMPLPLPEDFVL